MQAQLSSVPGDLLFQHAKHTSMSIGLDILTTHFSVQVRLVPTLKPYFSNVQSAAIVFSIDRCRLALINPTNIAKHVAQQTPVGIGSSQLSLDRYPGQPMTINADNGHLLVGEL